jgi:branched-chain amino acid transport system permease protein
VIQVEKKQKWSFIALGATSLVLLALPPVLPAYVVILLTQSLIFCIVAMSLDLLVGYTNMGSLGHAGYFAIGAYTTAILVTRYQFGFAGSLFSSIGMAVGASALLGLLALRAAGIYFLLITLAIAMTLWGLIYRWTSMTGGENGIVGIPRPALGLPLDMVNPVHFYYFILLCFVVCSFLIFLLVRSPFGRTLMGIRDSESRMRVLGFNVWLHKYLAYIIAGGFAGVGGNLYAYYNSFVSPNNASLGQCLEIVLMVSMGGPGTMIGANLGAFIITFLKNMVSVYTKRWTMILAAVYVLFALYAPEGIVGLLKQFQRQRLKGAQP